MQRHGFEELIMADPVEIKELSHSMWPNLSRKRVFFGMGVSVGILAAVMFSNPSAADKLTSKISEVTGLNFTSDVVMAGIMDMFPTVSFQNFFESEQIPGIAFAEMGVAPKYPIVMIPGFISTGLEVWGSPKQCFRHNIRQRLWGSMNMVQTMLLNTECWMKHMALDPVTGLDPPGIRLRAAQGFEAADFVVAGYWVWAKIIENLAHVGYDSSNMHFASYDWRLAPNLLEQRDQYFTKLTTQIESLVNANGKVVIVGHSMAALYITYFIKWVESRKGGNRSANWVNEHIQSIVHIGGAFLGVPKTLSAWLSGEMRDTAQLGALEGIFMKNQFSAATRRALFRTWTSLGSMVPLGGDRVWGNATWAPEEASRRNPEGVKSMGDVVGFTESWREKARQAVRRKLEEAEELCVLNRDVKNRESREKSSEVYSSKNDIEECRMKYRQNEHLISSDKENINSELGAFEGNWTVSSVKDIILDDLGSVRTKLVTSLYCWDYVDGKNLTENTSLFDDPKYFSNVFSAPLPLAPNLTIYSLYGVGLETERSYIYSDPSKGASFVPFHHSPTENEKVGEEQEDEGGPLTAAAEDSTPTSTPEVETLEGGEQKLVKKTPKKIEQVYEDAFSEKFAKIPSLFIDKSINLPSKGFKNGISNVDGDGTVPLLSLGLPGRWLWKDKTFWNKSGVQSVVKEYEFDASTPLYEMRGGKRAADHINIMGNYELIEDLVLIVTGHQDKVKERIVSDIDMIAKRIAIPRNLADFIKNGGRDEPDLDVHKHIHTHPENKKMFNELLLQSNLTVKDYSSQPDPSLKETNADNKSFPETDCASTHNEKDYAAAPVQNGLKPVPFDVSPAGDQIRALEEALAGALPVDIANTMFNRDEL